MSKMTLALMTLLIVVALVGWGLALRPAALQTATPDIATSAAPERTGGDAVRASPRTGVPASIAAISGLSSAFEKRAALHRLAAEATPRRLRNLISEASVLDDVSDRRDFLNILFNRAAHDDPDSAVRLLLASDLPGERPDLLRAIFYDWAQRDTEAALRRLKSFDDAHSIQAAGDGMLLAHARPGQLIDNQLLGLLPIDYNPGPALGWYLGTLAAHDPEDAAGQAAAIYDPVLRRSALHAVAGAWAQQDPAAALAYAATLADSESRWHFEHPIIERWLVGDSDALLAAIEALPDQARRQRLLRSALREIAQRDPQRAVEYVAGAGNGNQKSQLLNEVLSVWAKRDFGAALAAAEANLSGSQRRHALQSMVRNFAEKDPAGALGWALGYDGGAHLASAVYGAARTDGDATVAFLMSLERVPFPAREWQSIVGTIARHDADLAVTVLERIPGRHRSGAVYQIAANLAGQDIEAALEWAGTIGAEHRNQALTAVVQAWAQRDVAAAAAYVTGTGKPELIGAIAREYAQHDHRAAFEWLLAVGPDAGHMQSVIAVWAEKDPAEAAAVVALHTGKPWVRSALSGIALSWIESAPDEATAWLATLPENESTSEAIQHAVRNMAYQSLAAARRWAERLSGNARDNALLGLLSGGQLPADEGSAIANSIENPDRRYQAFQLLVFRKARKNSTDPTSAQRVLAGADLTPAQQQQILDDFARARRTGY